MLLHRCGEKEKEQNIYRPGVRGPEAGGMVLVEHAPVAGSDREIHGRVEPVAVQAKVSPIGAKEHPVLVQESSGKM